MTHADLHQTHHRDPRQSHHDLAGHKHWQSPTTNNPLQPQPNHDPNTVLDPTTTHNPLHPYPPLPLSTSHKKKKKKKKIHNHHSDPCCHPSQKKRKKEKKEEATTEPVESQPTRKKWATVMCDVDVGRRMVFGSEERIEQMRKREGRERREQRKWERGERKFASGENKFFFFLQYCYSAILPLELYCTSIAKFFCNTWV